LALRFDYVTSDSLKDAIKCHKNNSKLHDLVSIVDASQDDIGARANFGRGNITGDKETAYE
jgi:hypothetical protein